MNLREYHYQYGVRCVYCKEEFIPGDKYLDRSKDHIIPHYKGGPNHVENYIAACKKCNVMKGNMTLWEFAEWLKNRIKFVINGDSLNQLRLRNCWKLYNKTSWLRKKYPVKNLV